MTMTITALIVTPDGKPLAQHDAQLCIFTAAGLPKVIAAARTDDAGNLTMVSRWLAPADYQPRLQLQLMRGLAFAEASENPAQFADGVCHFGKVTFSVNLLAPLRLPEAELAARVSVLEAERETLTQKQTEALATRDEQLHALSEQLAAATREDPPETTIEALANATAEQLQRVRQTLQDGQSGLRLGKVALQLKVMAGRTGGQVALPQTRQISKIGAAALGSLDLAFIPDAAAPASRPQPTAPRVLGYTEAFARRKLAERRLGVEIVYQLVTSASEHGRVVLQRPEPDAPVAEGAVVLIAIGRQAQT